MPRPETYYIVLANTTDEDDNASDYRIYEGPHALKGARWFANKCVEEGYKNVGIREILGESYGLYETVANV